MFTLQTFSTESILQHTFYDVTDTSDAIPTYHYYDCTCEECRAIHFPCDAMACAYCESVRYILADGYKTITTEKNAVRGTIIDFATWDALSDDITYDHKNMVWDYCMGCNKLHNGIELAEYDGYHDEECKETYGVIPFVCRVCESTEVEDEDDICDECSGTHGYVIDEDQIEYYDEFWVAPNGDIYCVDENYGGHDSAAKIMGFSGQNAAENAGYIHISNAWATKIDFVYVPNKYTDNQVNACMVICETLDVDYPDFIIEWQEATVQNVCGDIELSIKPMQNLVPAWLKMTRIERDRFYPLSGD